MQGDWIIFYVEFMWKTATFIWIKIAKRLFLCQYTGALLQVLAFTLMLPRKIIDRLKEWKNRPRRDPLLLDGARQVGKTYTVKYLFGPEHFRRVWHFDFQSHPELSEAFKKGLTPTTILESLEATFEASIDIEKDLIFFDEIGDCQPALDSLKYFSELLPEAFVCASGSNIGLLKSFPVGKVEMLSVFPLCFEEFLMASRQSKLLEAFQNRRFSPGVHGKFWDMLLDYYFVGGMPKAVDSWFDNNDSISDRIKRVRQIHHDVVEGYRLDFGKYAGKLNAQHINAIFSNAPRQLASGHDSSVKRYRFKGVIEKKSSYRDLRGPIDWLETAKLVRKSYPVSGKPEIPLMVQARPNIFRLFLFDVGILGHMLNLDYADQQRQDFRFKGFIAENFVQTELNYVCEEYPTYGWEENQAEVEFLHRCRDGEIIPVEVKSGSHSRARSLRSYLNRYNPTRAVKLVGSAGGENDGIVQTWPLYGAQFLRDL